MGYPKDKTLSYKSMLKRHVSCAILGGGPLPWRLSFFNRDIHPFETSHIIMVHLNCFRWSLNLVGEKWSL
jgi:hypothetical protein